MKSVKSCGVLFVVLFALVCSSVGRADERKPVVVLVPGFFNSVTPGHVRDGKYVPYFSSVIVDTLKERGYPVAVATRLAPVDTVEQNGDRLVEILVEISCRFPGREMIVLAHSAGGLYSMRALTLRPDLPVSTLVTLATPYGGVDFIEKIASHLPIAEKIATHLNLESLREFRPSNMERVLSRLAMPSRVRWIALTGQQPPCFLINCYQSRRLNWVLSITHALMKGQSDGVVTTTSALAGGLSFAGLERWADFDIGLEHGEMVQEAELFALLGVTDTPRIARRQREYIGEIFRRLEASRPAVILTSVNPN